MAIKKNKASFDFLVFLFIIAIALGSYSSYSRYTSSVTGGSNVDIASWSVSVNTEDITDKATLSNEISFVPINSAYVAEGKIAPSVGGYFDVVVDTTNAEVAAVYTISIDVTELSEVEGLNVVGYEVFDSETELPDEVNSIPLDLEPVNTETENENIYNTISGRVISLNTNGKGDVETLRVFINWDENGANTVNTSVQIPVNIVVEQYFE